MGLVYFKEEDVQYCLDRAKEIREQFELNVLNGKSYPKSVDDLLWLCQEYLGKTIVVEYLDIPAEGSSIKGAFWAMEDGSYRIGLLTGMTDDELRFVLCKELFHVIFDEEGRRNIALSSHVEEYNMNLASEESHPNCSVAWEMLAEVAAIEFFFPYQYRKNAADETQIDYARLASQYGIPRFYVETFCSTSNLDFVGDRLEEPEQQ